MGVAIADQNASMSFVFTGSSDSEEEVKVRRGDGREEDDDVAVSISARALRIDARRASAALSSPVALSADRAPLREGGGVSTAATTIGGEG
jgi:hypothetical protein|tara:strand:- start:365 stop:637 length:273 start_codon:yes stop_codon:yes gene_type:complete